MGRGGGKGGKGEKGEKGKGFGDEHTMPSEFNLIIRKPPLIRPRPQKPRPRQRAPIILGMIRRIKLVCRKLLKALHPIPRDILQGHEGAVGGEEEIQVADADDGVVCGFDDALEDAVLGGAEGLVVQGGVCVVAAKAEDVGGGALHPVCWRGVDGFLDVGSVEVDLGSGGFVVCKYGFCGLALALLWRFQAGGISFTSRVDYAELVE